MSREIVPVTRNERGTESHPSFGMIGASRIDIGPPGQPLFQSDLMHRRTIRVRIASATRERNLKHDFVHASVGPFVEVELSEAQWASFVSSMNVGDGVPCTILTRESGRVPETPFEPRLAESMKEVEKAAQEAFAEIRRARDDLAKAKDDNAGAKVIREAERDLHYRIENSESNMKFAASSLSKHAENVVQKARADIEAMVLAKAQALGLTEAQAEGFLTMEIPRPVSAGEIVMSGFEMCGTCGSDEDPCDCEGREA